MLCLALAGPLATIITSTLTLPSYFSPETRSVHVTDPVHIRALWEMGFFGKGTLSRSEPSWLDRAKAKAQEMRGGGTADEATNARREERRLFKLERARLEREKIERQRAVEEGRMTREEAAAIEAALEEKNEKVPKQNVDPASATRLNQTNPPAPSAPPTGDIKGEDLDIANQEHLQLTLEEAFFLSYGLGVLQISIPQPSPSSSDLLNLFAAHATFPPSPLKSIPPDNPFLLNYVVYHHFRSLGWVVRSGLKFSCDYLLYQRGPVFSHAEFALLIIPSYSNEYWKTESGMRERRWKEKDWWWLHCVNRVQSQVKKTLVLVYVDVPAPKALREGGEVGELLRRYKVREFAMRRWIANRSRD
ncbi:putative tRNA-splicing endonuclease subunit tsp-2 [Teratosphaeria destructans]|uniref:tRNA-splicing endonuclease subunit Sen2 n=1 Tax=Teratosphaeria destructans TaxID=418781 RepID=A0A9W7SYM5_9PEZI|nr:putative tRNA-splicing endonuclease subunit tsp-2 [Teratosphaeria destructans]